jgi:hypothetical protein
MKDTHKTNGGRRHMKRTDILYSINVQDVQDVAQREFDRELNDKEIESVAAKLGEYIDWFEAVNTAVAQTVRKGETSL